MSQPLLNQFQPKLLGLGHIPATVRGIKTHPAELSAAVIIPLREGDLPFFPFPAAFNTMGRDFIGWKHADINPHIFINQCPFINNPARLASRHPFALAFLKTVGIVNDFMAENFDTIYCSMR